MRRFTSRAFGARIPFFPFRLTLSHSSKPAFHPPTFSSTENKGTKGHSKEFITSRNPEFDLASLGGYQDVLDQLIDVVHYLQDPSCLVTRGLKAPKGIILSGPPGTGKTVMAEAVAGQAGVPLFMLSAPELTSKYVGETEEKIRNLFQMAEQSAPCIICIDEIDSIGAKRSESNPNYQNSFVNQLLSTLAQNHPGIIVFATTNHYDALDPALVRPGRFDRHIQLTNPKLADRIQILTILTKNKKLDDSVSLELLAQITEGFAGARLNALVNEAGLAAFREGADELTMQHFDEARTVLLTGKKRTPLVDAELSKRIATHEIGHALVGVKLGFKLYKVVLTEAGDIKGYAEWLPKENNHYSKSDLIDKICVLLAARASEELSNSVACGSYDDLQKAKGIIDIMKQEGMLNTLSGIPEAFEIETIFMDQKNRARKILEENAEKRLLLIAALTQHGELSQADFNNILNPGAKKTANRFCSSTIRPLSGNKLLMPSSRLFKTGKLPGNANSDETMEDTQRQFSENSIEAD